MTSQFALDAAKTFQVFKAHPVKAIICAQGINAVFGVSSVVYEIKILMPWLVSGHKHEPMNGSHDLSKGCRSSPMASRSAIHRMDIHESHQGSRCFWIAQTHFLASGIFDWNRIFGGLSRCRGKLGLSLERLKWRGLQRFN